MSVSFLLVNPPLTDPTTAYHSIPYLMGAAREQGFADGEALDANIAALNHMARRDLVADLLALAATTRERVEAQSRPSRGDQMRYRIALRAISLREDSVELAIGILRDPQRFYDYGLYRQAVVVLRRWIDLLTLRGPAGLFDGYSVRVRGPVNLDRIADVTDPGFLAEIDAVFAPYLDGPFARLVRDGGFDVVGISVPYLSQLPYAVSLGRRVRVLLPDAVIVYGGTEVTDVVKYQARPGNVWRLFAEADAIVPGEGEGAFTRLLDAVDAGRRPAPGPGVMMRGDAAGCDAPVVYEHVDRLPAPRYEVWDWSAYWSPEPVLLYSPTRGCYWNKCTFCDYGLNTDRPTSPSRARSADRVAEDLEQAARIGRVLYFAVDAMSPSYLRRLCGELAGRDLGLTWAAELKLERSFPRWGLGDLLRRAGCVAISFGYESGSQRVLDLIDKGVRIADVPSVLEELARVDIGAQMMGFTGFPSETPDEAEETYRFLLRHPDAWTIAGIGRFTLTSGSIVAKDPGRFGVELLPVSPAQDVHRRLRWRPTERAVDPDGNVRAELQREISRMLDDRPFVGGIDSTHSILYFRRFGRRLVPDDAHHADSLNLLNDNAYASPFRDLDAFTTPDHFAGAHDMLEEAGGVTHERLRHWLAEELEVTRCDDAPTVIRTRLPALSVR